ncbi:MAG TPA: hypothetical protein VFA81_04040 [Burkholderiales bacterium]|nr:hypothetical protein [Burkholderiales bacterium]
MGLFDELGGQNGAPPISISTPQQFAQISNGLPQVQSTAAPLLQQHPSVQPQMTGHTPMMQSMFSSAFGPQMGMHLTNLMHGLAQMGQPALPPNMPQPHPMQNLGMPNMNAMQQHRAQMSQLFSANPLASGQRMY